MKSLGKHLRNIIFISLLLSISGRAQFLFTPFENQSSFKGAWNLSEEVPNYIAAYLREFYKVNVLSSTAYLSLAEKKEISKSNLSDFQSYTLIAEEVGSNYVVTGKVVDFDVSRFIAGESNIAGYEAYSCKINITMQIFDLSSNSMLFNETVESTVSNKGLGLNLFGIPSDEKRQYLALNKIRFGNEEFHKTIVGETMLSLCEELTAKIKSVNRWLLFPKKNIKTDAEINDKTLNDIDLKVKIIKGQLLTYDETTGEAFINLGQANGISKGDEFLIYAEADSLFDPATNEFLGLSDKIISSLQIIEVRGDKLSLAVINENRDKVRKGFEVRKVILRTDEN